MVLFLSRYVKTLSVLIVAMIVYALVMVPLVEPQRRHSAYGGLFTMELPREHWWQDLFPEGAWQTDNPEIIITSRGILLAGESEEMDEKTISFKPITMIMPQTQAGREAIERNEMGRVTRQDMWIVSAEEGATIHFEEPIKNFGGSVPKIQRGELSGAIEVSRQVASEGEEKPWRLRTRDLSINQTQLTTRNEVVIESGDSIVRGRDLLIRLRSDLLGNEGSASDAWGPLDELELYQVQEIDVALPAGGLWADLDPNHLRSATHPELTSLPARLRASCGGRFSFDFKNSTATLRNGVQVQHQIGSLQPDQFMCERIAIFLEAPQKEGVASGSPSTSPKLGGVQFKGFIAIGADSLENFVAEKSVIIKAPTIGLNAKCKRLEVDLQKRKVKFAGKLDSPGATQSAVVLNYQGNEFSSPSIEYQAAPRSHANPNQQDLEHLGWLVAEGPGEFNSKGTGLDSAQSIGDTSVRWQGVLRMAPAPDGNGAQWLELVGNTLVENAEHGFLTSERIEVWLERVLGNANESAPPATSSIASNFRPRRVFSAEATELTTPDLHATVNELDLRIDYVAEDASPKAPADPGLSLTDSAGNPMYQWIDSPGERTAQAPAATPPTEKPRSGPIHISGSSLRTTIARKGKQTWIPKLEMQGPVKLNQDPETQRETPNWEVLGDLLLLATNIAGEVDLQISGVPARMKLADGELRGEAIRFNQMHSVIFMDKPGEFFLPKSMLAKKSAVAGTNSSANTLRPIRSPDQDSTSIEWLKSPRCAWQGRMIFDGSVVRIEKEVEFEAAMRTDPDALWLTAGRSDAMDIHLLNPIDLKAGEDQELPKLDLDRIVLQGQVDILASQLDATGEKRSREEIHVPQMTFHVASQQLIANGPGWIHSRYLSQSSLGQLAGDRVEEKLQGAYLTFRDSLVALMEKRQVTLEGRVELLSSDLQSWEDSAVPSDNHQLDEDEMLLNCDQLKVFDTSALSMHRQGPSLLSGATAKKAWEFQATGDVAFNGNSTKGQYLGNGYQLTYSRAKNLLMLRGDGRKPGYLQVNPKRAEDSRFKAYLESVAVNPKTLSIVDLQLGQGGAQMESGEPVSDSLPADANQRSAPLNSVPNPRGVDFYRSNR